MRPYTRPTVGRSVRSTASAARAAGRRASRSPSLSGLLAFVGVAIVVAACSGNTADPSQLLTAPAPTDAAGSPPASGARSRETPAPPPTVDRSFDETETTREARLRLVKDYMEQDIKDERVLEAMRTVPRHAFVPTGELALAYNDHPLRIEAGQTISQPSLVAKMTELLQIEPGERVLEIGTGSGYQAAILAELTDEVYSVEIVPELAGIARHVLDRLGREEVEILRADGYFGWEAHAPYDAIVVTAAPDHLPSPLVQQLKPDGRMVIPIGPVGDVQTLWLVTRKGDEPQMERLGAVQFVPFTREGQR